MHLLAEEEGHNIGRSHLLSRTTLPGPPLLAHICLLPDYKLQSLACNTSPGGPLFGLVMWQVTPQRIMCKGRGLARPLENERVRSVPTPPDEAYCSRL
jgi:hypothetical protein